MKKCRNFMNLERIQETVKENEEKWGHPDEPPRQILDCHNCLPCEHGFGSDLSEITKIAQIFESDHHIMEALRKVAEGEPFRVCFKEFVETEVQGK